MCPSKVLGQKPESKKIKYEEEKKKDVQEPLKASEKPKVPPAMDTNATVVPPKVEKIPVTVTSVKSDAKGTVTT